MALTVHRAPAGQGAFEASLAALARHRHEDPLTAVRLLTPTPGAAVTFRRRAAAEGPLVGVGFSSLDGLLAEVTVAALGASALGERPTGAVQRALVADVIAEVPGPLQRMARHDATLDAVVATLARLDGAGPDGRAVVADQDAVGVHLVAIWERWRTRLGGADEVDRLAALGVALDHEGAPLAAIGPIVVHEPDLWSPITRRRLAWLGQRTAVEVIVGDVGIEACDQALGRLLADDRAWSGAPPRTDGAGGADGRAAPTVDRVLAANDACDEVDLAVGAVLDALGRGVPADRIAVVHPTDAAYGQRTADALRRAGVAFHGPSTRTLGQSPTGTALTAILTAVATDLDRVAVSSLWACGRGRLPSGSTLRASDLEVLSRRLGVVAGEGEWRARIDGAATDLARRLSDLGDDPDDDLTRARLARRQGHLDALRSLVDALAGLRATAPESWSTVPRWIDESLSLVEPPAADEAHDAACHEAIVDAVAALAALDGWGVACTPDAVVASLADLLARPAPRRDAAHGGVRVTAIDEPPVVPVDVVVVVGLVEGHLPAKPARDALLRPAVLGALGEPDPGERTRALQRRLWLTAAQATTAVVWTTARGDQRGGRRLGPSRWLLDAVEAATGARPRAEDLASGRPVPGIEVWPSHGAVQRDVAAGAIPALDTTDLVAAVASGLDDDRWHPLLDAPELARSTSLLRERRAPTLTRFDGDVGEGIDPIADGRLLSPTSLERFAACPRQWFFSHGLGIDVEDPPEDAVVIDPRDRGTLVHRILERFIGDAIAADAVPAPGDPWPPAAAARLDEIADEEFDRFERSGTTGHPKWWELTKEEVRGVLALTLVDDADHRAQTGATPVAVELTFGRDGHPPVEIDLGQGRTVALAGQADRVDVTRGPDGDTAHVYDYKYASAEPYKAVARPLDQGGDPLDRGRRLQLVAYAEAAARAHGVDRVSARYWFLRPKDLGTMLGYEVGDRQRELFRATLATITEAIRAGHFPANSGDYNAFFGSYESCGRCAFDRICPDDRTDEWTRVRLDPRLRRLVTLAEQGSPALVATPGTPSSEAPS